MGCLVSVEDYHPEARGPQELFGLGGARSPRGHGSGLAGEEVMYKGENVGGGSSVDSQSSASSQLPD